VFCRTANWAIDFCRWTPIAVTAADCAASAASAACLALAASSVACFTLVTAWSACTLNRFVTTWFAEYRRYEPCIALDTVCAVPAESSSCCGPSAVNSGASFAMSPPPWYDATANRPICCRWAFRVRSALAARSAACAASFFAFCNR
jgi:hypothetical protein